MNKRQTILMPLFHFIKQTPSFRDAKAISYEKNENEYSYCNSSSAPQAFPYYLSQNIEMVKHSTSGMIRPPVNKTSKISL